MHPVPQRIGTAYRVSGDWWAAGYHTGVDYLSPNGTTAVAPQDSKIIFAGWSGWGRAYGLTVIGESRVNGQTYRWICAHMQSTSVSTGQTVKAGQPVGRTNNTGNTTGPHLHFEVRHYPYAYGDDVNPSILTSSTVAPTPPPVYPGTVTTFDVSFWAMAWERWFGTAWHARDDEIIAEIKGQEPGSEASVWGFTEMYDQEQIDTLTTALPGFTRVAGRSGLEFWYDASKWAEERPPKNYASDVQGRWAMVTHLTRKVTGQHVAFVTFHGPTTYDSYKSAYGKWLANLLGVIDGPIVLMGDANRSVEDKSPRSNIRALGFRDMREQAAIINESADEFPSRGWSLSDIWTDLNDRYDDKIIGGQIDLTSARLSDHRRIECTVQIKA